MNTYKMVDADGGASLVKFHWRPKAGVAGLTQAKGAQVRTNQRDGQMAYFVDGAGENPHVNYEPSTLGGLHEGTYPTNDKQGPVPEGQLTRARIPGPTTTSRRPTATAP